MPKRKNASFYGFGRYLHIDATFISPRSQAHCREAIMSKKALIARGLGRSYGDSSLSTYMLSLQYLDHFISFDVHTGILICSGGTTLADILTIAVPQGWFLPVTPGTRFVTAGGAVASNVHGKNHSLQGDFCAHVMGIELLLGSGECVTISRMHYPDLFAATCGGMGLTGIILTVHLQLMPITSADMLTSSVSAPSLDALIECIESHADSPYRVAWLDVLTSGQYLGRGVLHLGRHAQDGSTVLTIPKQRALHVDCPAWFLNSYFIKCFNHFYYHCASQQAKHQRTPLFSYFYPLDNLLNWNRLYGKTGFLQYQCVLPEDSARVGLRLLLTRIAQSRMGSFLAVLKRFGASSDHYLSFPMPGFTLALDFRAAPEVFSLMNILDDIVRDHGGRVYLAKDARMNEAFFKATYPQWEAFEAVREKYHAVGVFSSLQSRRLGFL